MVRGNWQKRVESAEARRTAAKQRKQRRDCRGSYKTMAHDFLNLLNRHHVVGGGSGGDVRSSQHGTTTTTTIHMWVDSAPALDSPPLLDLYQDTGGKTKGGGGGNRGGKKGRGRSNSVGDDKKKKRAHPRSKGSGESSEQQHPVRRATDQVDETTATLTIVPRLCRKQFYSGQCQDVGRKGGGGCSCVHLPKQYKTLSQVVGFGGDKSKQHDVNAIKVLTLSEEAIVSQQTAEGGAEEEGVDMMYYLSVDVGNIASMSDGDESSSSSLSISDVISKKLADESCGIGRIVYLAIGNTLLFDRYRHGIVLSESDLHSVVYGDFRRLRSSSVLSDNSADSADNEERIDHEDILLPAHVLEYVLMFLPDESVSTMSLVCSAWYQEIGQHSPDLWRRLLERREWPMPDESAAGGNPVSMRELYRKRFIQHYVAVRDVEAVRTVIDAATNSSNRNIVEEKEMVYDNFPARQLAPQCPNCCVCVRTWSSNHSIAAYFDDCTLRLFKAVAKIGDCGSSRACREIVCVSVDPYRNTKRLTCQLVAMDLDEDVIGCLCHVLRDNESKEHDLLSVVRRDDFLCAAGSRNQLGGASLEDGKLHLIDVGESVLNFLLSFEDADHDLLRLFDFISAGGDLAQVDVLVSQTIQACGYGRFLVEVAVSIPSLDVMGEDDDTVDMIQLDRSLYLFSATAGAIVWKGGSAEQFQPGPRPTISLASFRHYLPGDRHETCSFAFSYSHSRTIYTTELDRSGNMQSPRINMASLSCRSELLEDNWQIQDTPYRPVVITLSDVIAVDSLFRDGGPDDGGKERRTVVSFYPRLVPDSTRGTLILEGNCEAVRMEHIHNDYVIVLCRVISTNRRAEEEGIAIDGQWFEHAPADDEATLTRVEARIIHVPSRTEIHRACLVEESSTFRASSTTVLSVPIFFSPCGVHGSNTLGVGLWWKGFVMTGSDVRELGGRSLKTGDEDAPSSSKKSKRKKRQQQKGGKKDGFARGMSLRG